MELSRLLSLVLSLSPLASGLLLGYQAPSSVTSKGSGPVRWNRGVEVVAWIGGTLCFSYGRSSRPELDERIVFFCFPFARGPVLRSAVPSSTFGEYRVVPQSRGVVLDWS